MKKAEFYASKTLFVFGLHLDLRCTSLNGHEKLIDLKFDSFKILVRNLDF